MSNDKTFDSYHVNSCPIDFEELLEDVYNTICALGDYQGKTDLLDIPTLDKILLGASRALKKAHILYEKHKK